MSVTISPKRVRGDFVRHVRDISGENINLCYQCGLCSGNCPSVCKMDVSPRRIIELARLGLQEEIAESQTVWVCASCLACAVNCPRGFDLSRVMEAIRLLTLRKNLDRVRPEDVSQQERCDLPQIAMVSGFRKFTG